MRQQHAFPRRLAHRVELPLLRWETGNPWDKPRALEVLAKHFRLLDDRLEVSGSAELMAKFAALDEGRARNAQADKS